MPAPDMHPLSDGRFGAQCGKCLAPSVSVSGVDADHAWGELVTLGWSLFRSKGAANAREYPLCPKCSGDPPDVDKDAEAAKKRRKRK